jgi:hypothetical protein
LVWLAPLGLLVGLAYAVVADGDLDFGQRDSPQYYSVGLSLAHGKGLTVPFGEAGGKLDLHSPDSPLSFYPPGLSMLLALFVWLGLPAMSAAVALQGIFIGMLGLILGYQVWRVTALPSRSILAALAGWSAGVVTADQFLAEPVYLVLVAIVITALVTYTHRSTGSSLSFGVLAAAFAALVRVIGAVLVVPASVAIIHVDRRESRRWQMVLAALGILGPVGIWVAATSAISNRSLGWHPPGLNELKIAVSSLSAWLAPIQLPLIPRVALAMLFGSLLILTWIKSWRVVTMPGQVLLARLWGSYAMAHAAALVVVMSIADAQTSPDRRQVAPIGLALVMTLLVRAPASRRGLALLAPVGVATLALGAAGFLTLAADQGYAEDPWASMEVMEYIDSLQTDAILSNSPEAIWINTGRSTFSVPAEWNPWRDQPNPRLITELSQITELARESDVVVVLFDDVSRDYLVGPEEFLSAGFEMGPRFDGATVLVENLDG